MTSPFWKSRKPPIYVWKGDIWYNEENGNTYEADIDKLMWIKKVVEHEYTSTMAVDIPFPVKTQVRGRK